MSKQWRTDEPEVGQVAWLKNDPPFGPAVCFISDRGKAWRFAHGVKRICDPSCPPWQPITTPEEARLRKRVRELEDILHEYFLARAGYMRHATKRLADECNRINQKREREGGGMDTKEFVEKVNKKFAEKLEITDPSGAMTEFQLGIFMVLTWMNEELDSLNVSEVLPCSLCGTYDKCNCRIAD